MANYVIEDVKKSPAQNESDSCWECPDGYVLVGRAHQGDELGETTYWYGKVVKVEDDGTKSPVTHKNAYWSDTIQESNGTRYTAPDGKVLVGRQHQGDENGSTMYKSAGLVDNLGNQVTVTADPWQDAVRESSHESRAPKDQVMIGRWHEGDENQNTWYRYGSLS